MRRLKKYNVVICAVLLLFVFSGCFSNAKVLPVYSADYNVTELRAADLEKQAFVEPYGEDKFDGFYCWVSKSNEYMQQSARLILENSRQQDNMSSLCMGSNGYFVGFDYKDFASGISFFSYSGMQMIAGDPLPTGRCVALLELDNSNFCYAVTSWNYFDDAEESNVVTLWRLHFPRKESDLHHTKLK